MKHIKEILEFRADRRFVRTHGHKPFPEDRRKLNMTGLVNWLDENGFTKFECGDYNTAKETLLRSTSYGNRYSAYPELNRGEGGEVFVCCDDGFPLSVVDFGYDGDFLAVYWWDESGKYEVSTFTILRERLNKAIGL